MMNHRETINQISRNTLMCIGARDFVRYDENTLMFRVTISQNQRHYISIRLNGNDLYDIIQLRIVNRGANRGRRVASFYADNVYCDQLDEVIYRLGSTRHASDEWLAECGIQRAA